jgi:DNA-binding MurR/RpiR family transcriptional regulator
MAGRGRHLSDDSIRQVVRLLASTEMTASDIAERMGYSKSTVITINRKFQVRQYDGLRTRWREGIQTSQTPHIAEQPVKRLVKKK